MFNFFPFTNFHELNTDWVVKTIKAWEATMKEYALRVEAAVASVAHAVLTTPQTLSPEEQTQARTNISAASASDVVPLLPLPDRMATAENNIANNTSQITFVNGRVNTIETQTYTNTVNINNLRDRMAAAEGAIAEKADADEVAADFAEVNAALAAIKTPHIVTLSRENNAYTLSESVTDIAGWIANGDSVIINAQGVGEYPGNPYPSAAEVQIADLKTAIIGNADAVEGTVTLSIGTAQEIKMTMSASAQEPDAVNVVFQTVPIGGGVEPVTVTVDTTNNTWSGATWEAFYNAYNHGCAFVNVGAIKHLCVRAYNVGDVTLVFTDPEFGRVFSDVSIEYIAILSNGAVRIQSFMVKGAT